MFERIAKTAAGRQPAGRIGVVCVRLLAACAMLLCVTPEGVRAQSDVDRVFEIRGVAVDVQAATAAEAQAQAIMEGRRTAWDRLVDRLVPAGQQTLLPPISSDELVGLTVGYEVARERTSDVRYLGSLNFRFNPAAVRQHFGAYGVGYAEVASRPVLILPVYNDGQKPLLWEEESPWLAAWLDRSFGDGLVPITVPYGDLADIRDITAVQAVLIDRDAIEAIAARYGAAQAVVANARTVGAEGGTQAVELNLTYVGGIADGQSLIRTVVPDPGDPQGDLLSAAARAASTEIQESWKSENLISPGFETRVTVLVPVSSFEYWLDVRDGLEQISSISRRELLRISRNEALLDVWVNGDADQLALALKQRNFVLTQWQDSWLLYKDGTELPERYRPAPLPEETLPVEPVPQAFPAPAQPLVLPPLVQ
ncbi:DUF2066 domain-containing protein [Nisaea acidiphila]|uniref:DUF2066 domain-containing protein n=1 Tax=Nisaea acidiphila TaxID=1862145 RepID=A0A9J7AZR3_9PROT|nr:DUF2066 domain-containing protein [Nisaea acidiphila]UUX50941.1 DUF2066 domain-containing protein [Nisaea acidiphila]